jgi:hypothetical protein
MVVDLSQAGAQIETTKPLRPGSRVHVRLVADGWSLAAAALVLRYGPRIASATAERRLPKQIPVSKILAMMSPEWLNALARYNRWMNEKLYGVASQLSDEARKRICFSRIEETSVDLGRTRA